MIKRLFVSLFLIAVVHNSYAQNQGKDLVDSLVAELPKAKEDTNKVKLLINIISNSLAHSALIDEALKYAEEAEALSEKLEWEKGLINSKQVLGRMYWKKGNYTKALSIHREALNAAQKSGDKIMMASICNCIGQDYGDAEENFRTISERVNSLV